MPQSSKPTSRTRSSGTRRVWCKYHRAIELLGDGAIYLNDLAAAGLLEKRGAYANRYVMPGGAEFRPMKHHTWASLRVLLALQREST